MSKYPRGSEWRRWDLHIHSPLSILNNQFPKLEGGAPDWEKYLAKLESLDLSVVGVTDYFTIEGYKKLLEFKKAGRLQNIDAIFPNIEFRLNCVVASHKDGKEPRRLNFHVIFSDDVSPQDIEEHFLHDIPFYFQGSPQEKDELLKLKVSNLKALGEKLQQQHEPFKQMPALEVGAMNAVVDHKDITAILQNDSRFKGKYLLVFPEELSNLIDWDGQDHLVRKSLLQKSDAVFSSNPNTREWCLGKTPYLEGPDHFVEEFKSLKPCIHGSDAHDINRVGYSCSTKGSKPTHDCLTQVQDCDLRNCWIKADPTFEGLKQIVYEPEERVRIQAASPYLDRKKVYFDYLEIAGSVNFILKDCKIPLNRGLVTLIGGRGSGKSALLESAAMLNEEHLRVDQNGKKKVIEYYRDNENNEEPPPSFRCGVSLVDKDGNVSVSTKLLQDHENLGLPFLYIGQEQLSGLATNDVALTRTVCDLIGIDPSEFGHQDLVAEARNSLAAIRNGNRVVVDILSKYTALGFDSSQDFEKWLIEYLKKLTEQQRRLSSNETRAALDDINKKTQRGMKLRDLFEKSNLAVEKLRDPEANKNIDAINEKIKELFTAPTLIPRLDATSQISAVEELKVRLTAEMDELRKGIIEKKNDLIRAGIKEDVNTLLQSSQSIQVQIGNISKDYESYKEAVLEIARLRGVRDGLFGSVNSNLTALRDAIAEKFAAFTTSRDGSALEEKFLFEGLVSGISIEGRIVIDEREFCGSLLGSCLDGRKVPNETELKKLIAGVRPDGTAKDLTLDSIVAWITGDLEKYGCFNRNGDERALDYIFTEWPDFLRVKAVVSLNGKPTEILSIGQRGTLLLKVYLATATAKQIFIIDQPEDNLDNGFIVNELVPLIRRAKHSRQLIMSTHNANLVVNADSDQVIVARLESGESYLSGSIEHPEINAAIRDILEGGDAAFRRREKRYRFLAQ